MAEGLEHEGSLRGVIFDLDGTLVDSPLDFDQIRTDMGLSTGTPILEALAGVPEGTERARLQAILDAHELQAARDSVLFEGVVPLLDWIAARGFPAAVLTRNSRVCADLILRRFRLTFSHVLTREDAPPKPDPAGLLEICQRWRLPPRHVAFMGDYVFDLEAGRRAGMRTVLFAPQSLPSFAHQADSVIQAHAEAIPLFSGWAR